MMGADFRLQMPRPTRHDYSHKRLPNPETIALSKDNPACATAHLQTAKSEIPTSTISEVGEQIKFAPPP